MFKKLCMVGLLATTMFGVTGCSSGGFGSGSIKIEDLDWIVEEAVNEGGERYVAFSYTNNSPYDVIDFGIRFKLKEPMTDEQLESIMANAYEGYSEITSAEGIRKQGVVCEDPRMAEAGTKLSGRQCAYDKYGLIMYDINHFNLTEVDTASISYIRDGKLYTTRYDFKSKKYTEDEESDKPAFEWSDSEIAKKIPKPDAKIGKVDTDEIDRFEITCYGVDREQYEAYAKTCFDAGFTDDYTSTRIYDATNDEGYTIRLLYLESYESLSITVKKE